MRAAALVLLVLGVLLAVGAYYVKGEVVTACSTQEARLGGLMGHPDAQKCRTYPAYADMGTLAGLALALLGVVLWVRR